MKRNERISRNVIAVAVIVTGLVTAAAIPGARADGQIVPVNANAYGNTYGDWSAMWWQWALSIPAATSPLLVTSSSNGACAQKQAGPVFFLALTFSGAATHYCTVPSGKALFFPILNDIFGAVAQDCDPSVPGVGCNIADLRVSSAAALDHVTLTATIDGEPFTNNQGEPVNLYKQRVRSPVLTITLPPTDNFFGYTQVPLNGYAPNVADGYWLMVSPLPKGKYTLRFKGKITGGPFDGFVSEVTYKLTVS